MTAGDGVGSPVAAGTAISRSRNRGRRHDFPRRRRGRQPEEQAARGQQQRDCTNQNLHGVAPGRHRAWPVVALLGSIEQRDTRVGRGVHSAASLTRRVLRRMPAGNGRHVARFRVRGSSDARRMAGTAGNSDPGHSTSCRASPWFPPRPELEQRPTASPAAEVSPNGSWTGPRR